MITKASELLVLSLQFLKEVEEENDRRFLEDMCFNKSTYILDHVTFLADPKPEYLPEADHAAEKAIQEAFTKLFPAKELTSFADLRDVYEYALKIVA